MNSTEKNFLSSLAISSKTRDSFGSFSSESTSSRNDTTSGRLATNTPRSPCECCDAREFGICSYRHLHDHISSRSEPS